MAGLPQDKKIVRVEYTLEDGSKYYLDEQNTKNYNVNMNVANGLLATRRSYFTCLPVEWKEITESGK